VSSPPHGLPRSRTFALLATCLAFATACTAAMAPPPSGAPASIIDGSLLLALPLATLAGLVSFLSPCVLPLVHAAGLAGA